jgi:hypothetical protein
MTEDPTILDLETLFTALPENDEPGFRRLAETVVAFQRSHCEVYRRYCEAVGADAYLPVEAFRRAAVTTFPHEEAELVFESSGTGRGTPAQHYVRRESVYRRSVVDHFGSVFGYDRRWRILAHLPGYTERGERSSLVRMAQYLIEEFGSPGSTFFLEDTGALDRAIDAGRADGTPLLLLGAAFGLLDLIEERPRVLPDGSIVIETGGMKTHRREIRRDELHARLSEGLGVPRENVFSEYGMCELLSQAYTRGGEVFYFPPWVRAVVVDPENPVKELPEGLIGALAVLDLANLYSVSPVLTQDRAACIGSGFQILGRLSHAELRGCNFLLEKGTY